MSRRVDAAIGWRVQVALGDRVERLEREVGDLRARLDAAAGEASWATNELARIAPQVASLQQRVERSSAPAAQGEADDVRVEHERVRARQALISSYEERLRRLEGVSRP